MKKEIISIPGIKTPDSPFNHVVKVGELLFLTSQFSCDLKTGEIVTGNIENQTRKTLENVKYLLEVSNSSLENIVKTVIYMRDVGMFERMNQVYREFFESGKEPARVTIQSPSPISGIDIEIEVTAVVVDRHQS